MDMPVNRNSHNPRGVWHGTFASGVHIHYFLILAVCSILIPFHHQSMPWVVDNTLPVKEGDPWQMWEFIPKASYRSTLGAG